MQDKTHIAVIIDRSGSMVNMIDDARGGLNAFFDEQKKVGKPCDVTLVRFDHEHEEFFNGKLEDVPVLDDTNYVPRGGTALLDAMGFTINTIGDRLKALPEEERPNHVIVLVVTDGHENQSREFSKGQIAKMVKRQEEEYNWDVIFMAANMDAISEGAQMGIASHKAMNFFAGGQSARGAYAVASSAIVGTRMQGAGEDKKAYMDSMLNVDVDKDGNAKKRS